MTQRRDMVKRLHRAAKAQGMEFTKHREGGNHTVFDLDGLKVILPRHREINENLARDIYIQVEEKLGKGWWRK
ncbi:hypothetical protein [Nesterenkonia sp. CF4.4]|uniref:hypothetical protein n=1 Tax=Nesterenkonia sp. CF4.4 TaxID=3373079 RepID=UPI003EE4A3FE